MAERFWKYVRKHDGCWEWTGPIKDSGSRLNRYGALAIPSGKGGRHKTHSAHRISWELHYGPIPKGMWVLHKCDNPPCTNPEHLFLGGPLENARDCRDKGRLRPPDNRGEKCGTSKLTAENAKAIRVSYGNGTPVLTLAAAYGVHVQTVYHVIYRNTWKHI